MCSFVLVLLKHSPKARPVVCQSLAGRTVVSGVGTVLLALGALSQYVGELKVGWLTLQLGREG